MTSQRIDQRFQFFDTLARELDARADQVRMLIGDRHWLSDGHHKEALLRGLLQRHLPIGTHATRGFVLGRAWPAECSKEQDIMILDLSGEAPLFNYEGLSITLAEHVLATISVKTTFEKKGFVDSISGLISAGKMRVLGSTLPLAAAYFFNSNLAVRDNLQGLAEKCANWCGGSFSLADLRCANEWCFRISSDIFGSLDFPTDAQCRIRLSRCSGVSTAVFVACVSDAVVQARRQSRAGMADVLDDELGATECSEVLFPSP